MLSDADRAAIDALRERLRKSIIEGDAQAYTSCFSEHAVLMHPDSPQVVGREAIGDYAAQMFDMVRVPLLNLVPVSLVGDGDLAYEVGVQECEVDPPLPGFKKERQHLHVYERGADGSWSVAAAMSGNQ